MKNNKLVMILIGVCVILVSLLDAAARRQAQPAQSARPVAVKKPVRQPVKPIRPVKPVAKPAQRAPAKPQAKPVVVKRTQAVKPAAKPVAKPAAKPQQQLESKRAAAAKPAVPQAKDHPLIAQYKAAFAAFNKQLDIINAGLKKLFPAPARVQLIALTKQMRDLKTKVLNLEDDHDDVVYDQFKALDRAQDELLDKKFEWIIKVIEEMNRIRIQDQVSNPY